MDNTEQKPITLQQVKDAVNKYVGYAERELYDILDAYTQQTEALQAEIITLSRVREELLSDQRVKINTLESEKEALKLNFESVRLDRDILKETQEALQAEVEIRKADIIRLDNHCKQYEAEVERLKGSMPVIDAIKGYADKNTLELQANLDKYASENELWEKKVEQLQTRIKVQDETYQEYGAVLREEIKRLKAAQKSMQCPNCGDTIIYGVDSETERLREELKELKKENEENKNRT